MLRVLIGMPLRVRPPLGAFRRLCAEPEVLAGPGGDGQGARLDGHPRDDLGLAVCPGRLCLRPRLQRERAECELRADACPGAPKPLITPIFPDFYRFFPVFPGTSGCVLWIPGVQTEKMGEKWGKMGKKWVKNEVTGVQKTVLMHASAHLGPGGRGDRDLRRAVPGDDRGERVDEAAHQDEEHQRDDPREVRCPRIRPSGSERARTGAGAGRGGADSPQERNLKVKPRT